MYCNELERELELIERKWPSSGCVCASAHVCRIVYVCDCVCKYNKYFAKYVCV